ncbi:3-isopropylmalate dehydrogenase [Anaerobium acetethylicum]|uniref:3-isopropylmalate dehydrogenase n=1 Tax=Anaerobium acetethylicum TaxID=1619234 RepID=A0A1D3TVH8_9FIRM|nr:3-isopropylmalate dehydrogenase [Anaerobium acetethylicum]SCP98152.1 3-isopropylmalate dehydrogenase [Anaerobium acetethylicum]
MILNIAVIKGDGVGPEMMESALEILKSVCRQFEHQLNLYPVMASGEAIDAVGNPMPEESLKICMEASAVLLGNTGLSKYRNSPQEKRPEFALMRLRKEMETTTNIRPVCIYPVLSELSPLKERIVQQGVDFVFVRDIAGGVFCSDKVKSEGEFGKEAYEYEYYNEKIITDTAAIAFELAGRRKNKVTNLDKSNVLGSSKLWRTTVQEVGKHYPEIELTHCYIDTAAMKIIESPKEFDVIVTSNLFGDIIADEGTQITGTPYLYASAEVAKNGKGIYTPNQLHHPDETMIGQQIVNPIGMIAAAAMMLRHSFGLEKEAAAIENAIRKAIEQGYRTKDIAKEGEQWLSTKQMGEKITGLLAY